MAEYIPDDICENVFLRLDVRDLGRCKCVCRLWKSFISGSRFIKAHLNLSYNSNGNGHKRIGVAVFLIANHDVGCPIIGSSNGIACIKYGGRLLLANPLTREVKTLPKPLAIKKRPCWGFGYDSLTDDYKVVLGLRKGKRRTCFQVFSLKSNAWNVIGEVDYKCSDLQSVGVLCNGAIHWIVIPKNNTPKKQLILSFDLSKEEFKEISQPDDTKCKIDNACLPNMILGIMEECLCLECRDKHFNEVWVMKKYNVKESWGLADNYRYERAFGDDFWEVRKKFVRTSFYTWFIGNREFEGVPVIVESLVSPHLQAENE